MDCEKLENVLVICVLIPETSLSLYSHSLTLLHSLLYPCTNLVLIQSLVLQHTRRLVGIMQPLDELESGHVVAHGLLLFCQSCAQVQTDLLQCLAHDSVGNYLMMMCAEKEKEYSRHESNVGLL